MNQDLLNYVKTSLAGGVDAGTVRKALLDQGWPEGDVAAALTAATAPVSPATPTPPVTPAVQPVDATASSVAVKLYDPNSYAIIGFFFGMAPVLFMSWVNASKLGEPAAQLLSRAKKTAVIFAGIVIAWFIFIGGMVMWVVARTKAMIASLSAGEMGKIALFGSNGVSDQRLQQVGGFPKQVISNVDLLSFVIQVVILVMFIRFTNKNEVPLYKQLKTSGQLKKRSAFMPIMLGLVLQVILYVGLNFYIKTLTALLLR